MALSASDQAVLDFEREWWRDGQSAASTKQLLIRRRLKMSPTSYYARLGRLAGSVEACAYDPLVVHRLRRRQRARTRARLVRPAPRRQRP